MLNYILIALVMSDSTVLYYILFYTYITLIISAQDNKLSLLETKMAAGEDEMKGI